MKSILKPSLVLMFILAIAVLTGCLGGISTGPQTPQTTITTHATINGVTSAWLGASLQGSASPGSYSCNPVADGNCKVNFGGPNNPVYTNSTGVYTLSSSALGNVQWTFAAVDATNSNICPNGASETDYPPINGNTDLYCNQLNGAAIVASPSICHTTYDSGTGETTTDCPAAINLTASQPTFPIGRSITASSYTEAEALVVSQSIRANSSTSITVPTPTTNGYSAVVFVDPTNNLVIGAAQFLHVYRTVTTSCGPGGNRCP